MSEKKCKNYPKGAISKIKFKKQSHYIFIDNIKCFNLVSFFPLTFEPHKIK